MAGRVVSCALALSLAACATTGKVAPKVDLEPARKAVEAARQAGAAERAAEALSRAQGHLSAAEVLVALGRDDAQDAWREADALARLATSEANCAAEIARLSEPRPPEPSPEATAEAEKLAVRVRRAEEEQRRLEERVALLQRDLEMTETEVIRTKARLKGNETRAEASSAIAEARILARRLADEGGRGATLAHCNELVAKAEQQLKQENYGAAAFFALKAQETAMKAAEGAVQVALPEPERPAPRKSYVVKAALANIRKGPGKAEPVLATAPRGTTLPASAMRGDWIKVTLRGVTGWVHGSVVE